MITLLLNYLFHACTKPRFIICGEDSLSHRSSLDCESIEVALSQILSQKLSLICRAFNAPKISRHYATLQSPALLLGQYRFLPELFPLPPVFCNHARRFFPCRLPGWGAHDSRSRFECLKLFFQT